MRLHAVHTLMLISAICLFALIWAIHPRSSSEPAITKTTHPVMEMVDSWPKAPNYYMGLNALDPGLTVSSDKASLFDPSDDYWGFPRDEAGHFELVDIYCNACHSLNIVMQQNFDAARWDELLTWMQNKQGMAPLPDDDRKNVVSYLSQNFGSN